MAIGGTVEPEYPEKTLPRGVCWTQNIMPRHAVTANTKMWQFFPTDGTILRVCSEHRGEVLYIYEHSMCWYVRLNTFNALPVHGPRFNAPQVSLVEIWTAIFPHWKRIHVHNDFDRVPFFLMILQWVALSQIMFNFERKKKWEKRK